MKPKLPNSDINWSNYKRKGLSEMRPYIAGEDMTHVSISEPDKENGSPKEGDMIGYLNLAGAKALAAKPLRGCIGLVSPKQSILAQSELTDCATRGEPGVPLTRYVAHDRVDLRGQREAIARGSRLGEGQNDKCGRPDSDNALVSDGMNNP